MNRQPAAAAAFAAFLLIALTVRGSAQSSASALEASLSAGSSAAAGGPAAEEASSGQTAARTPLLRPSTSEELARLSELSLASHEWGGGAEAVIEDAYRRCFRTYLIDGQFITVRMPFGENGERDDLAEGDFGVLGGGKSNPALLWLKIGQIINSTDFNSYVDALEDKSEKIIIYDLEKRNWSISTDWFYIDRMNQGLYPGLPHRPYVVSRGGVDASAVYDYIYCVGRVGMDCSGFVFYVLKSLAASGGINLEKKLGYSALKPPSSKKSTQNIGSWFFAPGNPALSVVDDRIENLRPGDVLLFRAEDGSTLHTAVIQSIDFAAGRIRYMQSTDEAPRDERGVHDSSIHFNPAAPQTSLKDPSLIWLQTREATFAGEIVSPYRDDGERYRSTVGGGGVVVRLKALARLRPRAAESAQNAGRQGAK